MVGSMAACDQPAERDPIEGVRVHDGALVDPDLRFRSGGNGGGIWVNNGLADPSVGGVDPAFGLSTPQGLSEETGVLVEPGAWIVAQYLVECALPPGASIVKDVEGQLLEFEGAVGLAPEWQDGSCDEDCQQWVSACMLARTNVSQQSVVISLRADAPSIGTVGVPGYGVYEASYFGNIFTDERHVCKGNPWQLTLATAVGRTCAPNPEQCGMIGYDDCMLDQRCDFEWDDGVTAIDCVADGDPAPYHTISVYVHDE
ncbi:hypothetical protein [Paraliomyxa miuraensis]|uniref:hypothetical protein n=1 Tax=Paraliomyxa miuraensis TaxID=376150 RepID=UPI002255B268|nr:hypothetical protein [Paraliomyxa miuraensis]MCX4241228.1 hypothetical protein [Paraliomyxa miuraensis]